MRSLYRWTGGELEPVGKVSEAHLRAWEYELASDNAWGIRRGEVRDDVRLWKTRRPDLAPAELWVGDRDEPVVGA